MAQKKANKASIFDTISDKMLERIQALRLIDDDFMTAVFSGDNKLTEFLLRILLRRTDLKVKRSMTQKEMHNIFGRSVRLDIFAEDTLGKQYNVEIQRAEKGADYRRVRLIQSAIDNHTLKKGDSYTDLPETYIIFITEKDIKGTDKPFYEVKKTIDEDLYDDGTHIVFVNGEYRENDDIGKLMHDFFEPNASKMFFNEIADRVRFFKQQDKGVTKVCRIVEEYGDERVAENKLHIATRLLRQNKLSIDDIAEAAEVPVEEVRKLASSLS